jgi:23S rRNA pseudouridine2605 synthase
MSEYEQKEGAFSPEDNAGKIRLNKFLASCGVESRRVADQLIAEGRVEINGQVVITPGVRVSTNDFVKVDGRHMLPKEQVIILLNKPRGFVCSRDAQGARGTVYDLLPPSLQHLNYVGRLDADSEGLLLMTNNGDLGQQLSHPSEGIEKEYWVTLDQNFDNSVLMQMLKGLRITEGQAKAKYVYRASARRAHIVLTQGLKRQIRQMFNCMGLKVQKLVRVRIGSLWGGDLEPGAWRFLVSDELKLVASNPKRMKKYLGARELEAYKGHKAEPKPVANDASVDDDANYEFDPADFEGIDLDADTSDMTPEMHTRFTDADEPKKGHRDGQRGFAGRREGAPRGDRREGGFRREGREGGFRNGRREGGFRGERREGGFRSDRREGGFRGERREGGFRNDRREGGFRGERREGGFRNDRREGGFRGERREGGFRNDRREGGFRGDRREGGSRNDRREGGFRGERREGGFRSDRREGGFRGDRREGGFRNDRREGGFRGGRREGGFRGFRRNED